MHSFHFSKQVFCKQGLCKCVTGDCQYDCDYANIVLIIHISDELAVFSTLFIDEDCHQLTSWLTSRKLQSDSTLKPIFYQLHLKLSRVILVERCCWCCLLLLLLGLMLGCCSLQQQHTEEQFTLTCSVPSSRRGCDGSTATIEAAV